MALNEPIGTGPPRSSPTKQQSQQGERQLQRRSPHLHGALHPAPNLSGVQVALAVADLVQAGDALLARVSGQGGVLRVGLHQLSCRHSTGERESVLIQINKGFTGSAAGAVQEKGLQPGW